MTQYVHDCGPLPRLNGDIENKIARAFVYGRRAPDFSKLEQMAVEKGRDSVHEKILAIVRTIQQGPVRYALGRR